MFWHKPPIFEADNFYGNPVNHWAPQNIVSIMLLCIPGEREIGGPINLQRALHKDDWPA